MKARANWLDKNFKLLEDAAVAGARCPQSHPHGPIDSGAISELIKAGRIRSEVYRYNYRVVTILAGPHKGQINSRGFSGTGALSHQWHSCGPRTEVAMSRHEIPARDPAHKIIVGWDHPLLTYFAQVIDRAKEDAGEDEKFVLWIGCSLREIYEVDELRGRIRRFAELTPDMGATLYGDKDEGR